MSKIDRIKSALRKRPAVQQPTESDYLSTGSTLLNLACTGNPDRGFFKGHFFFVVGDSQSGKTFIGLTCLAEAARNAAFDGYRFIYDDTEGGRLMDLERFFGKAVAERLEPPAVGDDGMPCYSYTVEEFYTVHLQAAFDAGKPFIYVLDSQDGLTSQAEIERVAEVSEALRRGKSVAGSYGDTKAKLHSANLRRVLKPLRDTGSILLILNQTRDSFSPFERSTYSGGRALWFYASLSIWSSVAGHITRVVRGKKRELGIHVKARVRKSRATGRDRTVVFPLYHSIGIDDVGGCVDYLVDEGVWKESGGKIAATGIGPEFVGSREQVVQWIEEKDLTEDLRLLVGKTWDEIEKACVVQRARRYT